MPSTIHIFGDFIRQQRKAQRMTQLELSVRAFTKPNRSFICQLENGKLDNITLGTIDRILMALDVDVDIVVENVKYDR